MTNNDDIRAAMEVAAMNAVQARPWSLTNHRQRGPAPSMKRLSISMPADLTVTIKEALALIERPPPASEDRAMNEATQSPPSYRNSDTGGREKRVTRALGEFIRHCFGNYARCEACSRNHNTARVPCSELCVAVAQHVLDKWSKPLF
jgi:hypothetical protein